MDWTMRWRTSHRTYSTPNRVLSTSFGLNVGVLSHGGGYYASSCCYSVLIPQDRGKYYDCSSCNGSTGVLLPVRRFATALSFVTGYFTDEVIERWCGWSGLDPLTSTLAAQEVLAELRRGVETEKELTSSH